MPLFSDFFFLLEEDLFLLLGAASPIPAINVLRELAILVLFADLFTLDPVLGLFGRFPPTADFFLLLLLLGELFLEDLEDLLFFLAPPFFLDLLGRFLFLLPVDVAAFLLLLFAPPYVIPVDPQPPFYLDDGRLLLFTGDDLVPTDFFLRFAPPRALGLFGPLVEEVLQGADILFFLKIYILKTILNIYIYIYYFFIKKILNKYLFFYIKKK